MMANGKVKSRKRKANSPARLVWRLLAKNKIFIIFLSIIAVFVFFAIFADLLVDYETDVIGQNAGDRLSPPSAEHFFGTDGYGRDTLSRIIYGSRTSLVIAFGSAFFCVLFGTAIGAISGYYGRVVDNVTMRLLDIVLAIPQVLLCIAVIATLGGGIRNLIVALAISGIPAFARVMRASVIPLRESEYIDAAKALGVSDFGIIFKHLIPNTIGPMIVQATMYFGGAIIAAASLSYIGLGVSPPQPEWGNMLADAQEFMRQYPYLIVIPGFAIILSSLSFNILGDCLRDAMDPRLRGHR